MTKQGVYSLLVLTSLHKEWLGTHCNAHGNNFVVRPPSSFSRSFLAPVDFDFAYDSKAFVGGLNEADSLQKAKENIDFEKQVFK